VARDELYSKLPNLVLAFHGCDISTYDKVLHQHERMEAKEQNYHWLGNGIYFWEHNFERAWKWAENASQRNGSGVKNPAVIGAIIDRGYCLNLLDSRYIKMVKNQYPLLAEEMKIAGLPLPINTDKRQHLDCAVIDRLCSEDDNKFDSVRGAFMEGEPIYKTSGFFEETHIQICVRNPNCIKGYFAPSEYVSGYSIP